MLHPCADELCVDGSQRVQREYPGEGVQGSLGLARAGVCASQTHKAMNEKPKMSGDHRMERIPISTRKDTTEYLVVLHLCMTAILREFLNSAREAHALSPNTTQGTLRGSCISQVPCHRTMCHPRTGKGSAHVGQPNRYLLAARSAASHAFAVICDPRAIRVCLVCFAKTCSGNHRRDVRNRPALGACCTWCIHRNHVVCSCPEL
jgi:hypothetical protein